VGEGMIRKPINNRLVTAGASWRTVIESVGSCKECRAREAVVNSHRRFDAKGDFTLGSLLLLAVTIKGIQLAR
jgi:hypothetical protein